LSHQNANLDSFEVILVADGCQDNTPEVVRSLNLPYSVKLIEQEQSGAAVARTRGAREAFAPLILFLDDDMEASPQLVQAHLKLHRQYPNSVALGYFCSKRDNGSDDPLIASINLWWSERFSEFSKNSHRFSFHDLFTGNVSLPKDLFDSVGGFDERLNAQAEDDTELGFRLLKKHARFRYVPQASSIHHDSQTYKSITRRFFNQGRAHVVVVRKHPEIYSNLPLFAALDGGPWFRTGRGVRQIRLRPWMIMTIRIFVKPLLGLASTLRARRRLQYLLGAGYRCNYWRGVLKEVGSIEKLWKLMQDLPLSKPHATSITIDLARDLLQLDGLLQNQYLDAVMVYCGDTRIGWWAPLAGAEPLRPEHLRHDLLDRCGHQLFQALHRTSSENSLELTEVLDRFGKVVNFIPRAGVSTHQP
jgi:GT2 family glycosyltransferase